MIVHNLDMLGVSRPPDEAEPELVIHADAVLARAIAG